MRGYDASGSFRDHPVFKMGRRFWTFFHRAASVTPRWVSILPECNGQAKPEGLGIILLREGARGEEVVGEIYSCNFFCVESLRHEASGDDDGVCYSGV